MTALPGIEPTLPTLNVQKLEGMAIRQALLQVGGNVDKAAKILGIGRATLYRRLKKENGEDWKAELLNLVKSKDEESSQ